MRRVKPETKVLRRVRQIFQRLGYAEGVEFDFEVAITYGARKLWADVMLFEGNIPVALVEAESSESAIEVGFEEGRLKAIAWNPEDPIPLLWIAAGKRDQCYRAVSPDRRVGVRYEPLPQKPEEILQPEQVVKLCGDYLERQGAALAEELRYRQILQRAFRSLPSRWNDHKRCQAIVEAIHGRQNRRRMSQSLRQIVSVFSQSLASGQTDFALARAFRWLMRRYFRPLEAGRDDPVRRYGRYFTPSEVVRFIVQAVDPKPGERILDFACGSGGFLLEAAYYLAEERKESPSEIAANLFGCDWDIGCVEIAKTVLELVLPKQQVNIVRGDGLKIPQKRWGTGSFDIVMSNPPAGDLPKDFSDWGWDSDLPQNLPNLYEVAFLVQAVRMAKIGGRIGILLPDGILTNAQLKPLRKWLLERVQLQAIVSLPRGLFPFTPSKMSAVIMRKVKPASGHKSVLLEIGRQKFSAHLEAVRQVAEF